jgi:hypothetical protein
MNSVFWNITPCNPVKVSRRFGGTSANLQDRSIALLAVCLIMVSLLRSTCEPDDETNVYLLNIGPHGFVAS